MILDLCRMRRKGTLLFICKRVRDTGVNNECRYICLLLAFLVFMYICFEYVLGKHT